jgi:uncharacterized protein (TIGR02996 family)
MMEVLFQTNRGWFPGELTEEFNCELEAFQNDVEVLSNGVWHRSALVKVYSRIAGCLKGDIDCLVNVENNEGYFTKWKTLKDTFRPYTPEKIDFHPDKERWDRAIDADPFDWTLRSVYADWLGDYGYDWLERGQRYQVAHQKTPGPACVLESAWHEATWFASHVVDTVWDMHIIKPEWCLSVDLFAKLKGYLLQRRDGGHHNIHAKSWNSRREAEIYLAMAINS